MLLKNYYLILGSWFSYRSVTLKDTSGTDRGVVIGLFGWCKGGSPNYYNLKMRANSPEGNTSYGIVVGTSDMPVSPDDCAINVIPHGTSSGQLYYHPTEVKEVVVSNNVIEQEITRSISNETDSDIEVKEFGLILRYDAKGYNFLIAREVSPVTVPAHGVLEVTFKFRTVV